MRKAKNMKSTEAAADMLAALNPEQFEIVVGLLRSVMDNLKADEGDSTDRGIRRSMWAFINGCESGAFGGHSHGYGRNTVEH